jgi:rare lipoprotein A
LTWRNRSCYKITFKIKEVRMATIQRAILLALFVALCQPLLPLNPLLAQEISGKSIADNALQTDEAPEGRVGVATYYAKRFHGRKTSSGVRYHPDKMTAASLDFPLGSTVKVKNLDNGKEVLVTVNDRCSKKKTPFVDLSRAAAKKLGFFGKGIARVFISLFEGGRKTETVAQETVQEIVE